MNKTTHKAVLLTQKSELPPHNSELVAQKSEVPPQKSELRQTSPNLAFTSTGIFSTRTEVFSTRTGVFFLFLLFESIGIRRMGLLSSERWRKWTYGHTRDDGREGHIVPFFQKEFLRFLLSFNGYWLLVNVYHSWYPCDSCPKKACPRNPKNMLH